MVKIALFFFFVCTITSLYAQQALQFEEIEQYPASVEAMFTTSKPTDEDKLLIARFSEAWQNGTLSENEKIQIVQLSGLFKIKKARNIHYLLLWRCILSFKDPLNTGKGYDTWMDALYKTCQERRTTPTSLQTMMNATELLLNKKTICSSPGNEWRTNGNDYHFEQTDDGLTVLFGTADIFCYSAGDSIRIGQTTGRFNMATQQWTGRGGNVTWERAGFEASEVYATLGNYEINMKQSRYEADSVMFVHKIYFPTPVKGKLSDKVMRNQGPATALYPEFQTHDKTFVFENIYPDVSFEGGILIQGARTIGSGTDMEKALIRIEKGDSLKLHVRSKSFVFRNDRINARNTSLHIYLKEDSVFHANLSFVYLVQDKEVSFIRSDAASSKAPYNNSYHKVDMNFEQLIWRTDEPLMSLSMTRGSSMGRAEFRSQNYYNQDYFERMQYFDATHPLVSLRKAAQSYGTDHFPLDVYASYISKSLANTRSQIIELAKLGFVVYDSDSEWITVQPRLYTFLHAAAKLTDFDVIDLRSIVNAPMKNATMDVSNYDLNIYGVEHFMVSDSQRVIITPNEQKVTLRKNRSIDIDGRIDAGQIELYGDSLHFDYDTFRISLHRVDSLIFYVPSEEKDAFGKPVLKKVKNMLQKLTGDIRIDQPDNKSGRFSLHEYPILNSDSSSFVYYGSSDIEQGAYGNDQFYFEVDPFVMDSIDNFSKEQLQLSGRFASADIFDDMRQVLSVQPDYSLGFVYETGDSAISTYGDAKLSAQIKLSSKGLEASGVLDYLTASIHADDINIYPDSLNVPKAKEFTIKKQTEGTEFPEVRSNNNKIHWEPKNDRMYIYKPEKVFDMYEDTKFDGNLVLTSNGLSGSGRIDMGIADIRSDSTVFRSESFTADTSLFRLRTATEAPYQMVTVDSVRSVIDFTSHKGQFLSVKDYALVRFPANKFEAYIDDFTWHMDSANIRIGADTLTTPLKEAVDFKYKTPGEGKGIRYYSTIPGADSLNFVAESADFDYMAGRIKAEGVKLVQSANALIFPDQGKLSVEPNGLLELGGNTRIVFNDSLKQHTVHSASINITGRKNFTGSGKYDYIDETGKITEVDILNVSPGKSGLTVANAGLGEEDGFMISPYYHYQGRMSLLSGNEFPEFDGAAQIVQECETLNPEWFKFRSVVNPHDVKIEVGEAPVNRQNAKIYNGLFLTTDSAHIYPAFFSKRKSYSDQPLIQAHGQLSYDKDSMIYFIASEEKLNNRDTATGNMLAFNRDICILSGEGRISLGVNLGRIKTDAVGRVSHHMHTRETFLDILLAVDFFFDDGLASMMASKIDSFPGLSGVDLNRVRYIRGMNEWLGTNRTNNFRKEAALGKVRNFPDELKHTLLFTQLNLQWNQSRRSYRSIGKIGIGNLFGHQVNRLVDGLIEISKRPGGGDMLDIYLKMGNDWFYFGYTRELMQIISSDRSFNSRLMGLSEKQRKSDERRPGFTYTIASEEKIKQFLAQMQKDTPDNSPETNAPIINTSPVNDPDKTEEETPIIEIE